MAPVQQVGDIPGLSAGLLTTDNTDTSTSILPNGNPHDRAMSSAVASIKTLASRAEPKVTSTHKYSPGHGAINPDSIHMKGLLALFALLGAAFVLAAIWFFFWAKNGGFVWRKGDWDEYKSTVLRRKGPDGKTLSNATKSTKLGGGSIVGKGYSDVDGYTATDTRTGYGYTESGSCVTNEKGGKKGGGGKAKNFKETAKKKLLRRWKDEKWEGEADDDVRAYRQEKPARVGGINREADGTYHGSDYDTSHPYTESDLSEVRDYAYSHEQRRQERPRDFSFTPGTEDAYSHVDERSHLRGNESATRRHDRRRERRGNAPNSRQSSPRKQRRSGYAEPLDFSAGGSRSGYQYSNVDTEESGTKSYHHPIPALSKGYRRDGGRVRRRDSLSDSEGDETGYM